MVLTSPLHTNVYPPEAHFFNTHSDVTDGEAITCQRAGERLRPFYLLIDIKTDAKDTYAELCKVLEGYADLLTVTRDGKTESKAITVVITGNCDRDTITKQAERYAAIDGRPADLDTDLQSTLVPWVSAIWTSQFKWDGTGPIPEAERAKLKEFVAKAHKHSRLVRFWATPEKPEIWRELLAAEVDLINTDKLAELRTFLLKEENR